MIGRSLRSVVELSRLGERTVYIDCDVIEADGGTRTASITGATVALAVALKRLCDEKRLETTPLKEMVAATSVGLIRGKAMLDLDYSEDSTAEVDMNVVMTGGGRFVEVQATAEGRPFEKEQMNQLLLLAEVGIQQLIEMQKKAIQKA